MDFEWDDGEEEIEDQGETLVNFGFETNFCHFFPFHFCFFRKVI